MQDDFYEHVNGKVIKEKKAENEGESWDNFASLSDRVKEQIGSISKDLKDNVDKYEDGTVEKDVAKIYKTALDTEGREKAGYGTLAPYLEAIKSVDSIENYLQVLGEIRKELGKTSLITFLPEVNPKNSEKYALFIDEPNMLLAKDELEDEQGITDIKTYVMSILEASGMEGKESEEWGNKLVDFYKDIADAALSKVEKNDVKLTTNYLTDEDLQAKLTNMDVKKFIADSGFESFENRVVINTRMLEKINGYLTKDNLELLKQYTTIALLNDFAPYLNNKFVEASAKFNQIENMETEEKAWESVKTLAEFEIGEIYAKKYFSQEKKAAVEKLVSDILAGYKKHIDSLDWLSAESKEEAKNKIDNMAVKIGYPENYTSFVKGNVKSTDEGGTLIENAIAISKLKAASEIAKGTKPVDRGEWGLSPQIINAYYEASGNQIVFPAAMLQEPFYNENASYATNLGAIGAIIAHEITHAFDDAGSLYDDKGNYRDWWTAEDRNSFTERAKKFIEYFGSIEAVPGAKVDGELTLGENIANTGGISVISSMLENDIEALKEMFKSYATSWVSTMSDDDTKAQLKSDVHAPAKVRVNGVLSATDAFYKAFNVKPGDKMYVEPEKRAKMF
ncbi:MAG: M13 family metallopeptidase [Tissierellia bacterium]|nr:M13 family metallopeptidase [Tissierellia bacterium]